MYMAKKPKTVGTVNIHTSNGIRHIFLESKIKED